MSLLPVLLGALAGAVAILGPAPAGRVGRVLPRVAEVRVEGRQALSPLRIKGAAMLAGLAVWGLLGGPVGAAVGAVVAVWGPRLLGRLDDEERDEAVVAAQLPLALDLLAACLAGGATTAHAVDAVARALPGPCGARLVRVGAALGVGSAPADAWRALGDGPGPAGAAARALARATDGGAPVAAGMLRVAEDARREGTARAERAARRAGVLAVGPLGLCFLPAFLLLGVVPAVVGLAGPLLVSL